MQTVRTRFAPSPTGFMHIGNLRTCLYAYLFAKKHGGKFILRIEDTDRERLVEGASEVIYRTLKTAGIEHDEGPDRDGGFGPYVQSERKQIYGEYAKKLVELGGAYYCFCTKERLDGLSDGMGIKKYDKHCLGLSKSEAERRIAAGEPYVIRQNIPESGVSEYDDMVFGHIAVDNSDMEDNILIKSDGMPTYNFANVVDDHLMQISHVMRGSEYLSSTPKYNLIYDAFGWERPKYIHLPPIMKDAQRKLSKRYGDANFEDFIAKGYLPEAIVNYIALLGWSPKSNEEKMSLARLAELFDVDGISKSGSIFDEAKMRWLNGEYFKEMTDEQFLSIARPYIEKCERAENCDQTLIAKLLKTRVEILSEIPEKLAFLTQFGRYDVSLYEHAKMKITRPLALKILETCLEVLACETEWTNDSLQTAAAVIAEKASVKKGQVYLPWRLAVTGVQSTPGGATEMSELFGKITTLERIEYGVALLKE